MNAAQQLLYYDRYENRLKPEAIYGENPLRWAYGTALGRFCLGGAIKRPWFSALYGLWADSPISRKEVAPFIERFGLEQDEFLNSPQSFRTFNDFFSRELRPEARPISRETDTVVFPADGRHLLIPDLSKETQLYAKGQQFDLVELLGDATLANEFAEGSAILSRLCPTDYHRFHFPLEGFCGTPKLINGNLYSVSPIALSRRLGYITENKRQVTEVRHEALGRYLYLEIGATNVGSIINTAESPGPVIKGAEKGFFRFGGSMVITIFPSGTISPAADLSGQSERGIETYARMGDRMATLI